MNRTTRIKITELNPHVICVLCGGYYINATTITECLHSFCRTCITRYLETSKYCPVCDVMVHKTRPLDYIRSDKTLQDLVYKLVPGLYKSEMKRRREYYAAVDSPGVSQPPSEDRGDEFYDRIIYTEDEKISLSLELCADGIPFKTPINVHGHTGPENIRIKDVRYLQCPAAFSIGNLKKFIRMKFDLKMKFEIDIFHTAEPLPDYYSLMDIAYIYTWTRRAPLRLYYTVFVRKLPPKAPDPISRDQSSKVNNEMERVTSAGKNAKADDKQMNKKRKLLEGPDDISPDLDFEKCKPYKGERRKGLGTPKKRVKKVLVEVDDSVKEAMSESEEQLAKLTLDCSGDVRNGFSDVGSVGSNSKADNTEKDADDENDKEGSGNSGSQKENVKSVMKVSSKSKRDEKCDSDIFTNINIETNTPNGSAISDKNGAIRTEKDAASSTQSSAQVSPGSGSISLSLFQPLNEVTIETQGDKGGSDDKVNVKSRDKMFEFQSEDSGIVKKTRGRPKGSKNKTVQEKTGTVKNTDTKADTETKNSLVVSKNHPGLKSPKGNESLKKVDTKPDTPSKKSVMKTDTNVGSDKVPVNKNKSENGEKVKRKYVRKKKAENLEENCREAKRPKKDNNKECKELDSVTSLQGGTINENSSSDNVDKDNVNGCGQFKEEIDKETVPKLSETDKDCVQNKLNSANEQISVNSSSLQEPVTPLYGETPKVNESNQGLPCSPNMDSFGEDGRLVIDTSVDTDDNDGANTKDTNDHNVVKSNNAHSNGAISENINVKGGDMVSNRGMSKEIFRNGFGIYDGNLSLNNSTNNSDIPNAHTDQYRNAINALSPTNALTILGSFSPSPLNAHVHMGHMTGSNFSSHDQNFDQPLDLTNNATRDEYTKGKIFKTKMLKKSYPKQETVQCLKEKSNSSVNQILN